MDFFQIDKVEYGVNYACFTQNEKNYICSCQKQSIINRLRLYDEYFCRFCYYDIVTGITYSAGDSELKRKVLGLPNCIDKYIDYNSDIVEQLNFKPHICHECNNVPAAFFSPLHPRSRKWQIMPYRINRCISLGIYPCKSLPPRKGRYYFFLDEALSFREVYDCTFSGTLLNNFQYRRSSVDLEWYKALNMRFNIDEQRKLLCAPGYFGDKIEKEVYWDLFDSRRSIKRILNNLIDTLLTEGINDIEDCNSDYKKEECRIYDYTIKDGKIVMDKLLEPFFRTDLYIYLKYSKNPTVLGFCFKIRAYNRFYETLEGAPVECIADEIVFAPNVIINAKRLGFYSQSYYFKLLAHGMQISDSFTKTLLLADNYNKEEVLDFLFEMTEESGLHSKLVPIIQSFYKKDMGLSYHKVKRNFAELLLRILCFHPRLQQYSAEAFTNRFADDFSNELKEANVESSPHDIIIIYKYVSDYLNNFIDDDIPLRSIKTV